MNLLRAALFAAIGFCTVPTSQSLAQSDYPNKSVRIIIGFSPGSVADTPARLLAQKFSAAMGLSLIHI